MFWTLMRWNLFFFFTNESWLYNLLGNPHTKTNYNAIWLQKDITAWQTLGSEWKDKLNDPHELQQIKDEQKDPRTQNHTSAKARCVLSKMLTARPWHSSSLQKHIYHKTENPTLKNDLLFSEKVCLVLLFNLNIIVTMFYCQSFNFIYFYCV